MAAIVGAGILSVLVIQFRILAVSAECLDTDSEEYRNLNTKMNILTLKIQDFVTYQTKFRNLERKVLVRELNAKKLERRLQATEGGLGEVKMELEQRLPGATSGATIRERADGSQQDGLDIEEWLLRERAERHMLRAKVEVLMQENEEIRKVLNTTADDVQKISKTVSDLETGYLQLGMELDDTRREIVTLSSHANASEERKGPPLTAEQSRTKLNAFLKDVEELNLFEAAANHSLLMDNVGQLSQRLVEFAEVTEATRKEVATLSSDSKEVLSKVSALRRDIDLIRDVVEMKPWEGYTIRELGSLEEKMRMEMSDLGNKTELICKEESLALGEQVQSVSSSLQQLKSEYEDNEANRRREQEFRRNFLSNVQKSASERESSVAVLGRFTVLDDPSELESASEDNTGQISQRTSAVENIRRLSVANP